MATDPDIPGAQLLPGERVRWAGRPAQGLRFTPQDSYLVPFSLLWGGFAVFWNANVWSIGDDWFMRLWGLPFLLAGLYVTIGRFAHDAWARAHTYYAVTDRRVLITRGRSVRSLDIDRLPLADMVERTDGSGTLRFGDPVSPFGRNGLALWSSALDPTAQFIGIADVRAVYALITRASG